jgi:hypothetical protein
MVYIALLAAKLLSPSLALPAILIGSLSRRWTDAVIFSVIAAAANEALLQSLQASRAFESATFLIGYAAAIIWALAAFGVKRMVAARRTA